MSRKTGFVGAMALAAGLWAWAAPAGASLRADGPPEGSENRRPLAAERPSPAYLRVDLREEWAALPHEQRQQMRQQMREQWRQAPPDSREPRRQNAGQWPQPMPQEDRSRLREDLRESHGGWRGRREGWR